MANAPQNKPGGFGKASRTLSLWVLAILVPFVFFQMTSGRNEQSPPIDYSVYLQQLNADNISRVSIIGGRDVTGEFKNRILIEGRETKRFSTEWPVTNSETEVERLNAKNVAIKAEKPRLSIGSLLLEMLPWIIIIGMWVFVLRQMHSGGNKRRSFVTLLNQ